MNTACNFSRNSYIYLYPSEKKTMKKIIDALRENRSLNIGQMKEIGAIPGSKGATSNHCLWILVAIRVIDVREKGLSRDFKLNLNWDKHLRLRVGNAEYWSKGIISQ